MTTVKTRFAPSPTGYLHIGGARTALYAYLYAQHKNGQFVLRIEDTDRERSTQEAIDAILEGMNWLQLQHDEGPHYQTQHMDRYREVIQQLLDTGHAYRCYCTKERLDLMREEQRASKQKPKYDGHCRDLNRNDMDKPHVIRFKNPLEGEVVFDDKVRGTVTVANTELDDLIIARTDGTPTYNLTVVVDDWDMNITHVIRGDDHINNTPRQMNILKALGVDLPVYAHLPMINGPDGKKLSKRHGAVSVMEYRKDGYLAPAVLNYLIRLGWSHGDQEIFSLQEMIAFFDLNNISKSSANFNIEKLQWLNQHYMKSLPADVIARELQYQFELLGVDTNGGPALENLITAQADRCKTLKEMAEQSRFFYEVSPKFDEKAVGKHFTNDTKRVLQSVHHALEHLHTWDREIIHDTVRNTAEKLDLKMGKVGPAIRIATTGNTTSPSLDLTLLLLGKQKVLSRLETAVQFIEQET